MRNLFWFIARVWLSHLVCMFGGSSGPPAQVVPVPPPQSLFPSITGVLAQQGPGAVQTATGAASDVASGLDVSKIYKSITDAAQRQGAEGQANLMSSMGASGMAASSDAMKSIADYQNQFQANLLSQLQQMQFQNEALKLSGADQLMQTYGSAGMTFAPTAAVVGQQGGPSPFSQYTSAASGSAMAIAMLMMACWVAAELYGGWSSLEVHTIRSYGRTRQGRLGRSCWWLYVKFGQRVANYIKTHRRSRTAVKLLFDFVLSRAFSWRMLCHKQVL